MAAEVFEGRCTDLLSVEEFSCSGTTIFETPRQPNRRGTPAIHRNQTLHQQLVRNGRWCFEARTWCAELCEGSSV